MIVFDWIESYGKIKSYYNVGGLFERFNFKLIEFLRDFYKDEVRELVKEFGFFEKIYNCMFFLGLGLVVRVFGEVIFERVVIVREVNVIVEEEIEKVGFKLW